MNKEARLLVYVGVAALLGLVAGILERNDQRTSSVSMKGDLLPFVSNVVNYAPAELRTDVGTTYATLRKED